jgi:hypothetical protein
MIRAGKWVEDPDDTEYEIWVGDDEHDLPDPDDLDDDEDEEDDDDDEGVGAPVVPDEEELVGV